RMPQMNSSCGSLYWPPSRFAAIATTVTFLALCAANYFAFLVPHPTMGDGKFGPDFAPAKEFEHGWPLSYVRRHFWRDLNPSQSGNFSEYSAWRPWEGVQEFSALAMAVNALVAIGCVVSVYIALQRRQALRRRKWQITLVESLAAMLFI